MKRHSKPKTNKPSSGITFCDSAQNLCPILSFFGVPLGSGQTRAQCSIQAGWFLNIGLVVLSNGGVAKDEKQIYPS